MDVNALKPAMRDALRERGHSDQAITLMSPREAFDEYCTWHGIIHWGDTLWEQAAALMALLPPAPLPAIPLPLNLIAHKALLEVGKVDGMVAGLLSHQGSTGQPSREWLQAFSDQREKMWGATDELRKRLLNQPVLGAAVGKPDGESQKIVVVIEGGMVRSVLAAEGGFSVAVIEYDKNADIDDLVVIPQGDGEKNAYALAAIHEAEVTDPARVDELYSAVVEAKPASEDDDRPRMKG